MCRQPCQFGPQRRHAIVCRVGAWFDRAELLQEPPGILEAVDGWLVEPGKVAVFAGREQMKEGSRQIAADCLGRLGGGTLVVRRLVPEPPADAGPRTAGATGPLFRRGLRDRHQLQSGQPRGR